MPSIITSLGIALEFRLLDDFIIKSGAEGWTTAMGLFTSGLGAHLTWTLPFGLLIMFPLIGHATWHAYRDLVADVRDPADRPCIGNG